MNLPATFDLTGKTALVTGASRGLGKHFAVELARAGVDVAITSRTVASLADTVAAITALGRRAVPDHHIDKSHLPSPAPPETSAHLPALK